MSDASTKANGFVDGDYEAKYWTCPLSTGRWQAWISFSQKVNDDAQFKDKKVLPHDYANKEEALAAALQDIKNTIKSQPGSS